MNSLLEPPAAQNNHTNSAQTLRTEMAAMRLSFTWFGVRKALSSEQKAEAADTFGAQGEFLSAGKKLVDTRDKAFRAVTQVRHKCGAYWRSLTLPFPEVDRIIPNSDTVRSRLLLSAADRTFLQGELAALAPGKGEPPPVTVELNGHVILRSRPSPEQPATELTLSTSRLEGNPVTCLLKGHNLRRAINLGFEQVNIQNGDIPLFCDDGRRQYVWMPLDSSQVLPASEGDLRISSPTAPTTHTTTETTSPPTVQLRRHVPMPSADPAVRAASEQKTNTPTEPKTRNSDPVAQVAALYEALRNTTAQCHTLIRTLKRQRREARLVQTTLASLRQLQEVA